jgi:hypothetical protein
MSALHDQYGVRSELLLGVVVSITLLALGESTTAAAGIAAGFLVFRAVVHAIQQTVGDYADHVLFGGVILLGAWYLGSSGVSVLWIGLVVLVGGWFLLDGIQHLRHGRSRERSDRAADRRRKRAASRVSAGSCRPTATAVSARELHRRWSVNHTDQQAIPISELHRSVSDAGQ